MKDTRASAPARSWRIWAVMTAMGVVTAGVVIRLVLLQVTEHQQFVLLAGINQNQVVDVATIAMGSPSPSTRSNTRSPHRPR
jgi:hypothetical protein